MASADLLLHPVRLRIVKAFLGDRALTTAQLAAELDDVPAGSLYRHIALLTKAGVLQVVAERRVRGAVERTYAMRLLARDEPGRSDQGRRRLPGQRHVADRRRVRRPGPRPHRGLPPPPSERPR